MDPHFAEYIAAVAGMSDLYGEIGDERPTDFHLEKSSEVSTPAVASTALPEGAAAWDHEPSEEFAGSGIWTL